MKALIIGFGNTWSGDESVGSHAIKALRRETSDIAGVELVRGGIQSFSLADIIRETNMLIAIDTAELNSTPGSIRLYEGEEMDHFICNHKTKSTHQICLSDLLTIARLTDGVPTKRALIGVQTERIRGSDCLSKIISDAIPEVCQNARGLLQRWAA